MADWIPGINVGAAWRRVTGDTSRGDEDIVAGLSKSGGDRTTSGATFGRTVYPTAPAPSPTPTNPTDPNSDPNVLGSRTAPAPAAPVLPALNQAAINNTQISLDQLPALLEAALAAEGTRKTNILNAFNDQEQGQRKTYDESTTTNQQNYDSNYMASIRQGVKGLGGLFGILRGSGAAGGTAEDLVRDTVGGVTANDIRMGADTQKQNQTSLDSVLSNFLTELKGKRQSAEDTFTNNERAIRRDNVSQMQDLYSKMAGYYGEGGRVPQAQDYMAKAGALTPQIAQNSMARQSVYDTAPVAVKAPEVTAFAAPTQPDANVIPSATNEVGSGIFSMNRQEEEEQRQPVALSLGV